MTGYQDFVNIFGSGLFVRSKKIKKKGILLKRHFPHCTLSLRFTKGCITFQHRENEKVISLNTNKIFLSLCLINSMVGEIGIGH